MVARSVGVSGTVRHGSADATPRWPRWPRAATSAATSASMEVRNISTRGKPASAALWASTWLDRRRASRSPMAKPSNPRPTCVATGPLYPWIPLRHTSAIDGWRRFGEPRFRNYHYLALAQGVVGVLAGFDVVIPWALAMGCPPFVAILLGVLPLAGGIAQLVVPRLLDRTGGNLRGLTILIAAVGEPRGLYFAALAALYAAGIVSGPVALFALAVLLAITSVLSSVTGANLLSWHSAVLPDQDRRLVVPRLLAVSLAIGALLLLPMAALLDTLVRAVGVYAYALPFVVSGVLGLVELWVLFRLRHPGVVLVPPAAATADNEPTPDLNHFFRSTTINAIGMGITPSFSVLIISVLGMTAGFAMMTGAIGTLTMVVAAAFFGDRLTRGSSSRMLRGSFGIRAMAMTAALLTWPLPALAPVLIIAA